MIDLHGAVTMLKLTSNRILDHELALLYDSVKHEWRRVLFYNERGQAVEVLLTPSNMHHNGDGWNEVARMIVHMHSTFGVYGTTPGRKGDALWRYITRNKHSLIFDEVRKLMARRLPFETINHLLYWDILPAIDWEAYVANKNENGGCALTLCKRCPR